MHLNAKSFCSGLFVTVVFSFGSLVGCSSTGSKSPAPAPDQQAAKPAVKDAPSTVTVHGSNASGKKAAKAGKASGHDGGEASASLAAECSATGDERKIAIKPTPSGGCEVLYTKGGKTTSITSASHETSKCQQTFDKVKGNLEKAGFKCN